MKIYKQILKTGLIGGLLKESIKKIHVDWHTYGKFQPQYNSNLYLTGVSQVAHLWKIKNITLRV